VRRLRRLQGDLASLKAPEDLCLVTISNIMPVLGLLFPLWPRSSSVVRQLPLQLRGRLAVVAGGFGHDDSTWIGMTDRGVAIPVFRGPAGQAEAGPIIRRGSGPNW